MNAVVACSIGTTFLVLYVFAMALQPVRLSVSKRQSFAPLVTTAQIVVPRHSENRELCVYLYYGGIQEDKGCWDLSADSSPVFNRTWKVWEPGRHFGLAQLSRGRDTYSSNVVEVVVVEGE